MKQIKKLIGLNILGLRKSKNWTQKELSEKSGISRASISLMEIGKDSPGLENSYKLAITFGVELNDILPKTLFYFSSDK